MCYTCQVPQLNLYVPEDTARLLRQRAKARGVSVSRYLASVVLREAADQWPAGYFRNAVGAWRGELKRPRQLPLEKRETY
jgi:post-segregation antitoxin (ccd killing protein)